MPCLAVRPSSALILLAIGCGGDGDGGGSRKGAAPSDCAEMGMTEADLAADIEYLADPELDGRYPGSEGDAAGRQWIADRLACLGLEPLLASGEYEEAFTDYSDRETANVLAALPGTDEALESEIILVSAHHDHLGDGRLGANDNASGVAGLLAIASALVAEGPARRTVIFAAFGSEESGFEGSEAFYTDSESLYDPHDVVFNLNLDMIGSYDQTDYVYALGTLRGTPGRTIVEDLADGYPSIDVGVGDWSDLSDNVTFCSRGIPYVFMWTDDPDCYHKRCDTADRIDYPHLVDITGLTADATRSLADSDDDLEAEVQPGTDVCSD